MSTIMLSIDFMLTAVSTCSGQQARNNVHALLAVAYSGFIIQRQECVLYLQSVFMHGSHIFQHLTFCASCTNSWAVKTDSEFMQKKNNLDYSWLFYLKQNLPTQFPLDIRNTFFYVSWFIVGSSKTSPWKCILGCCIDSWRNVSLKQAVFKGVVRGW